MSTVVIAGLGGLGCPAALSLAEAGVERLVLVDDDHVDLSNLARQVLYTTEDVGRPKIEVAAERLRVVAPGIALELVSGRVDADTVEGLLAHADLILDATDDPGARFVINDAALARRVPAVLGGIHRFEGLVLGIGPGFGPCFRCLFEDVPADDEVATCAQAGVLGPIAGIVGHLQARRALGLLAGDHARHTGFVTTVDGVRGRIRQVPLPEATGCPSCGGLAGRLDIRADQCPITYVRTKLALEALAPGDLLDVVMRRGDPARNVPRSLREDGYDVVCQGALANDDYRVLVRARAS